MAKAGRGVAAAGAALTLLAACGSNVRSMSAPPPPPAGAGLRGTVTDSFDCPPAGGGASSSVRASAVTALLVCRRAADGVTLSPADPRFGPLVSALSEADLPRQSGPCPLYADVVQPVLARTASQVLVVHVPIDGCGHYRAQARAALRSVSTG